MQSTHLDDREPREVVEGIHLRQLVAGEHTSVQHFRIEPGAVAPEHSHHHEQTGHVLTGELTFLLEDGERVVGPGDTFVLGPEEVHGAENRGEEDVVGVEVFSPSRGDPDWAED